MAELPPDYHVRKDAYTTTVYRQPYPSIDPTSPALSQAGKVVIITGASSGIGARGFGPCFAKARPKALVLVSNDYDQLIKTEQTLKQIAPDVEYLSIETEITSPSSIDHLFATVKAKYGHADVLVNNAGVFGPTGLIGETVADKWWYDFEVNVKGTYLITRGFLSLLGREKRGTVISMSTGLAVYIDPTSSSYSISKLAVARFSEYLHAEYPNVTAVSIQPGVVQTGMVIDRHKRFALDSPELVGGTGVWLATNAAMFLSGRFISANWSVDELVQKKHTILAGNDLKIGYEGKFGLD